MRRHIVLGDALMFAGNPSRRRLFLIAIRYYPLIIGFFVAAIVFASVYSSVSARNVTAICLCFYALYKLGQHFALRYRNFQSWFERNGQRIQILRAILLTIGLTIYLNYLYLSTDYLESTSNRDLLWLLYFLPISIASQYGISVWLAVITGLSALSIIEMDLIKAQDEGALLFVLVKVLWLCLLGFIIHVLTRFINDISARQRVLHKVQEEMVATYSLADEQALLDRVASSIAEHFRYPHVNIFELQPSGKAKCVAGASRGGVNLAIQRYPLGPERPSIVLHVFETGETHLANNVVTCRYYHPHEEFSDTKAELVVPIKIRGKTVMVIDIQNNRRNTFIPVQDEEIMESLADYVGKTLENIRLIRFVQRGVETIVRPLYTAEEMNRSLEEITEGAGKTLEADTVVVYQYNTSDGSLNVGARYGELLEPQHRREIVNNPTHLAYVILMSPDEIDAYFHENINDFASDSIFERYKHSNQVDYPAFVEREKIKSRSIIRLRVLGHSMGVMFVNFRKSVIFTERVKREIHLYAGLTALAIYKRYSGTDTERTVAQLYQTQIGGQLVDAAINSATVRLGQIINLATRTRTQTGGIDNNALKELFEYLPEIVISERSSNKSLRRFAASALNVDADSLNIRYDGDTGASGAPVCFVDQMNGVTLAAIKVFPDRSEFARELSALQRLEVDNFSVIKTYKYLNLGKSATAGKEVGIAMMSIVRGVALNKYLKCMGQRIVLGQGEAFEIMKDAVTQVALALHELHTKPKGSNGRIPSFYTEGYIRVVEEITKKLVKNAVNLAYFGIDVRNLQRRIEHFIEDFRIHPGGSALIHGDAHPGNFFYDAAYGITIIDVPTMHSSMDENGVPIGAPARDIANFTLKLAYFGRQYKVEGSKIAQLQTTFEKVYNVETVPALTLESLRFFQARTLLGEALVYVEHVNPLNMQDKKSRAKISSEINGLLAPILE